MILLLFTLLVHYSHAVIPQIVTLDPSNYKETMSRIPTLTLYYIEDDEDSQTMRDVFRQVVPDVAQYGLTVAEVNCANQTKICEKANLESIPELRIRYANAKKKSLTYDGVKDSPAVLKWVEDCFIRRARVFDRRDYLEAAYSFFEHIAIGYFPSRDSPDFKVFLQAGEDSAFQELYAAFISPNETELRFEMYHTKLEITDNQTFDEDTYTLYSLKRWVKKAEEPLFEEYTYKTSSKYQSTHLPVGYYHMKLNYIEEDWVNRQIAPVAYKYRGKMLFTYVDHNQHPQLAQNMGIKLDDMPGFVIVADYPSPFGHAKAHYPYVASDDHPHPTIASEEVLAFVADYFDGKVPLKLRSEPVPETQVNNTIKIVGDTFKEIVMDEEKDVFVCFVSDWCDHCFHHMYEWDHLANETKGTPNLVIGVFDVSKNDYPPEYIITRWPTMLLFKRGHKDDPIKFTNSHDYKAHVDFLREHVRGLKVEDLPWPDPYLTEREKQEKKSDDEHQQWKKRHREEVLERRELMKMKKEDDAMLEDLRRQDQSKEL